jgi:hypothetical protein
MFPISQAEESAGFFGGGPSHAKAAGGGAAFPALRRALIARCALLNQLRIHLRRQSDCTESPKSVHGGVQVADLLVL